MTARSCLADILVCPSDRTALTRCDEFLLCQNGHRFPLVAGIPVLLLDDNEPTHRTAYNATREMVETGTWAESLESTSGQVDSWVQDQVAATCGRLWKPSRRRLKHYPIPDFPRRGTGLLLDVGCNWGRWSLAAARSGFRVVGIDPSLPSLLSAQRVARDLGVSVEYVVGDARWLPFATGVFDEVFSYSVLQHFSQSDVRTSLGEVGRVLKAGGTSLVQMPNKWGVVSLYQQLRRGFRTARDFQVRYWSLCELEGCFEERVGETSIEVEGFFGLGVGAGTVETVDGLGRAVVIASQVLKRISGRMPVLLRVADSVYVHSRKAS